MHRQIASRHGFTIASMGWPIDFSAHGFDRWQKVLAELARSDNICVDVSRCMFGRRR
jgi:hypothetical protein